MRQRRDFDMTLALGVACGAQEQTPEASREAQHKRRNRSVRRRTANGTGCRFETYAVAPGTTFLVRLEEEWVPRARRRTRSSK